MNLDLPSTIVIARPTPLQTAGLHTCLDVVARELIYLEMVEAPSLGKVVEHQCSLISSGAPVAYAFDGNVVVGWADITPSKNPRMSHRGSLGMGVHPAYRGAGLGTLLLAEVLKQAESFGFEKVELGVYSTNIAAVMLYKKMGFVREGLVMNYRKLGREAFNLIEMAKFFTTH